MVQFLSFVPEANNLWERLANKAERGHLLLAFFFVCLSLLLFMCLCVGVQGCVHMWVNACVHVRVHVCVHV